GWGRPGMGAVWRSLRCLPQVGCEAGARRGVWCNIQFRLGAGDHGGNEAAGDRREADACSLMTGRMPKSGHPVVWADERQVVGHEWPESAVRAHHLVVGEEGEQ